MKHLRYAVVILILGAVTVVLWNRESWIAAPGRHDGPGADTGNLTDIEVKSIIDEQRAARPDLPGPFPESEWTVREQGNYYTYIEYGLPKAPGFQKIFKLNRDGVIVDAYAAENPNAPIDCPDKVYSASELAAIVERERRKRDDLPDEFPEFETRVDRMRCLYLYFEYAVPEAEGKHHVFVIDPFGELMEVFPAS